jgi:hypothetical protein
VLAGSMRVRFDSLRPSSSAHLSLITLSSTTTEAIDRCDNDDVGAEDARNDNEDAAEDTAEEAEAAGDTSA